MSIQNTSYQTVMAATLSILSTLAIACPVTYYAYVIIVCHLGVFYYFIGA